MTHVVNITNLNDKILKGLTLQLVIQNYPTRDKFAAIDSGKGWSNFSYGFLNPFCKRLSENIVKFKKILNGQVLSAC